jgi:NAD(P)-dependent dehydrogenase (short-subunit alcohol dehydrogenase family)
MKARTAIVTGANRGIGDEICRQLAQRGITVVLTSRDAAKGNVACDALAALGLPVQFHQLDISDDASVAALRDFMVQHCGGADILVNNAGIMPDPRGSEPPERLP